MSELCSYAREILTRTCEDTTFSSKLTVHWETEESTIYLQCRDLDIQYPSYELSVRNKNGIEYEELIYIMDAQYQYVGLRQVDPRTNESHTVEHSTPQELTGHAMMHLRSQPSRYPEEPRNNQRTEHQFKYMMVDIAINEALEAGEFELQQFIGATSMTPDHRHAVDAVLSRCMAIDDISFPYTRSEVYVKGRLNERVREVSRPQLESGDATESQDPAS